MWAPAAAESAFRRRGSPFDKVSVANARSYLKIQNGHRFQFQDGFKYLSGILCLKIS